MIATALILFAQAALPGRQQPQPRPVPPAIVRQARIDTTALVNFHALSEPDTVYVGQQTTYELGVFLERNVRDRLRRMEAIAPDIRGLMSYDASAPTSGYPARTVGTHRYEATVYQRPLFPLAAGRFVVQPARLVYALPLSYSFFSREESYELLSDSVVVIALEPPREGRPSGYTGAVGQLRAEAQLDTLGARVGDPLTLAIRIAGTGNVKLFPRPVLHVPWARLVAADERVQVDSDAGMVSGSKEFRWVLTPLASGRLELPPLQYVYFDPERRRYDSATTRPVAVTVAPGALARIDSGATPAPRPRLALRTAFRGELAEPLYTRRPFWLVLLLLPLPALALVLVRRPRPARRERAARVLARLARGGGERGGLRRVRRAYLLALAERLAVPSITLAEPLALRRALRRAGAAPDTAEQAADFLAELNAASFARSGRADGGAHARAAAQRASRIFRAADRECVARDHIAAVHHFPGAPALLALLLLAGAVAAARAGRTDDTALRFARAVASYEHGDAARAARTFAAIAEAAPRAPDAWANLGTASWTAGDTVLAAVGWQRALRLEPLAGDVRERMRMLPAESGAPGSVPAIPLLPLVLGAAALWAGAWLLVGWRAARHRPPPIRLAGALLCAALLAGAGAAQLQQLLAGRRLAVLAAAAPLRSDPQLGAERGGTLRAGAVVRVDDRERQWAHVAAGSRDGWVDASLLVPLALDSARSSPSAGD